jgi:hypothetical protein
MPQHVNMDREADLGSLTTSLNHSGYAGPVKWCSPFANEDECRFWLLLLQQSLEPRQFIAFKIMGAVVRTLKPSDLDGAFRKVDIIPAEIAKL